MSHDATEPFDALETRPEQKGRSRLTPIEQITIAHLSRQGLSIRDIAEAVGRSKNAIHANLKASRQLLEGFAHEFALDWKDASAKAATRGDHRPAMDALERLRVVEPLPKPEPAPQGPQFQVNIGLALPGLPTEQRSSPHDTRTVAQIPQSSVVNKTQLQPDVSIPTQKPMSLHTEVLRVASTRGLVDPTPSPFPSHSDSESSQD